MKILFVLAVSVCAWAQEQGSPVNQVDGPPVTALQAVLGYSGTNLVYTCYARSVLQNRTSRSVSISAATNNNPVVFTSNTHGFAIGSRPSVTISGGTGNWTAINGTSVATVVDANSFSIAVDSTSFGALTGTITFTTTAPRLTVAEWSVKKLTYDGSNNLIFVGWQGGTQSYSQKCSDATGTTLSQQ